MNGFFPATIAVPAPLRFYNFGDSDTSGPSWVDVVSGGASIRLPQAATFFESPRYLQIT